MKKEDSSFMGKYIFYNKIKIINYKVEKIHAIKWEKAAKIESKRNR